MRAPRRSERSLEPRAARWRRRWRRLSPTRGATWQKTHRNSVVTFAGVRVRRLQLAPGESAARIEADLRRAWRAGVAPEPLLRDGNEVWMEYIEGEPVDADDPALISDLAGLYTSLWASGAVEECPRRGGWVDGVHRDLAWLEKVAVLEPALVTALQGRAEHIAPAHLWRGLEYVDLRPANLIRSDGLLKIIDVESFSTDFPLGAGIAKAAYRAERGPRPGRRRRREGRWLAGREAELIEALAKCGAPDLRESMPFVRLCMLAWWQKRCVLRGKWKQVDPALFRALLER